jgi:hypothetical protein
MRGVIVLLAPARAAPAEMREAAMQIKQKVKSSGVRVVSDISVLGGIFTTACVKCSAGT